MNKWIIAGAAIVAVVGVGAGVLFMNSNNKSTDTVANNSKDTSSENKTAGKKACGLIDLEEAKRLLGDNATLLENSGSSNLATNEGVTVDNCSYSADGATLGDMKQLTIQIHSGNANQVKEAYENYKQQYPGEALPEFGNAAYYSTETRQVNVLKGKDWFFVGGGSINGGDEANKELAIQAARIVIKNL